MNVLSLFDGMSCGRLALDRLGIEVDKYYASEIDKYAIQVSQANYPDIIQIGDVCDVKAEDLEPIDLILAGSPCQGFSFAGAQLAFDDPRSALFFEFVRLLKECNPKYFLLENVKMKKEYLDIISDQVGVEPILINSALLSAQNRQRYYWTNIPNVKQPEDRGIVLRNILETEADERPTKDTERNRRHYRTYDEKSLCMTATMYKGAGNNGMTLVPMKKPKRVGTAVDLKGHDQIKRVYSEDGKSPTLTTCGGGHREPKVMVRALTEQRTEESKRIRKEHRQRTGKDWSPRGGKEMVPRKDGKMNTLTTSLTKSHTLEVTRLPDDVKAGAMRGRQVSGDGSWTQQLETRDDGKTNSLTTVQKDNVLTQDDVYWRKLTPLECERLQTVPDNYTDCVSNTQRYKMLGNGWTIEVIAHILENITVPSGK